MSNIELGLCIALGATWAVILIYVRFYLAEKIGDLERNQEYQKINLGNNVNRTWESINSIATLASHLGLVQEQVPGCTQWVKKK